MWQTLKDIRKLFQNKSFIQELVSCIIMFVAQFTVFTIIAQRFNLYTGNSLTGLIGISIMSSTILVFLIKTFRTYRKEHPVVEKLWLAIGIIAVALVVAWGEFVFSLITGRAYGG